MKRDPEPVAIEWDDNEMSEEFKFTLGDYLKFLLHYIKIQLVVFLLFIPETLKGIKNFLLPRKQKNVEDQVALVTGSGNGLGRAIAFRLAEENCKLAIVDLDFVAAQQTAQEIHEKFNITAVAFKADVSRHEEVAQLKAEVENTLGSVDILVNNAALLGLDVSLRDKTPEVIQKIIDVNLTSHFWITRAFLPAMIAKQRGNIVAICSMTAKITVPCAVAYCATKCGLDGFMEALFDELCFLKQNFVKLTTVYPSYMNTSKSLEKVYKKIGNIPSMKPANAANLIVKAMLADQRKVYVPRLAKLQTVVNLLPDRIIQYVKSQASHAQVFVRDDIVPANAKNTQSLMQTV